MCTSVGVGARHTGGRVGAHARATPSSTVPRVGRVTHEASFLPHGPFVAARPRSTVGLRFFRASSVAPSNRRRHLQVGARASAACFHPRPCQPKRPSRPTPWRRHAGRSLLSRARRIMQVRNTSARVRVKGRACARILPWRGRRLMHDESARTVSGSRRTCNGQRVACVILPSVYRRTCSMA